MMEQMTKDELKTGMHVVTRDGSEWVVLRDTMFNDKDILMVVHEDDKCGNWLSFKAYNQNMTTINREFDDFDIIKVYQPVYEYTTLEYKFDCCPEDDLVDMIFAEETMTKAEVEKLLGVRIID